VTAQEERLARIELDLEQLRPSLHDRLEKLEKAAERPAKKGLRGVLAWMGPALPQLITSLVILFVGLGVKDSVDLAVKQQQLQLSYVKEMKEQLEAMAMTEAGLDAVERAAVLVAAFGEPAVMPLMNELRYGGNRTLGAEAGLRSLAFMNPDAVCKIVPRVIANPVHTLGWEGQMVSARILAAGGCKKALPILREQERLLMEARAGNAASLSAIVNETPSVTQQKEWLRSLQESIGILSGSGAPRK